MHPPRSVLSCVLAVFLALVIASGLFALTPAPVYACLCMAESPSERLDGADAAFVGTLIEEPDRISGNNIEGYYIFRVEQSVKGDLPGAVRVRSPLDGSACGFELAIGQRTGVALYDDGNEWTGGRCTQIDADDLLAAAKSSLELSALRILGFGVIVMILGTGMTLITLETRRRQAPELAK